MKATSIHLDTIRRGTVIPAAPLALNSLRKLDERRQRALMRYYIGHEVVTPELLILVAACEINKVYALIMLLISILLPSLGLALMGIKAEWFNPVAAWSGFAISILGFYGAGAVFLNGFFGRSLLPLGKPLGLIPSL